MLFIEEMLSAAPTRFPVDEQFVATCIEAVLSCAIACNACADACLAEDQVERLRRCIRLNLDCADVCEMAGRTMSRLFAADKELLRTQLEACVRVCSACGEECERHANHHRHCRICAEACRFCEEQCRRLVRDLSSAEHLGA